LIALAARAASLVGVALVGWSLNVKWGSGSAVRGGPPMQWERFVVGAALLAALAAIAVWIATRPSVSSLRVPLRAAALLLAAGVGAIALHLRGEADRPVLADLVNGPGWTWLTVGGLVSFAAAAATFAVRAPRQAEPTHRKRRR
jgi:hypothetical protein